ncbi:AraC family transcriptional regulator ligand-binding domain-containing protein [Maribacter sp. TH_r10]|uniref:AraC family transcriptional regulator n=1 Tax=Maribacter sp. TH_r10 TaxID=3082086 RepID=UPI0029550E62|nr:AraC family transcriptional regulator ligand-binding domain-containing protein [Maribacter sp. TH_r10]MDV7140184.1 AraC family transcriptional regulator ligand-binding domain-containing protein [Maribacter sp. TH_r10]
MKYFSVNLYRKMLDCAKEEGMSGEDFMDLSTPINALNHLQVVSAEEFLTLHELLADKLGRGFAVRVGQKMIIKDYGVLGLSWRTCSRVGEIFERSERYFKLLSNTFDWQIKKEGSVSHIVLNREANRKGMELSTEASLSATVVVLKAMSEKNISPIQVSFKHKEPKDLTSHKKAFNCPILFEQSQYSISYRTEDLNLRTAKADASINSYLLQQVDEKTKGIKIPGSKFVRDIESLIKDALPTGIPSIHHIADLTAMSNRTLTRRLSEAGVTYRDLIKKTQETIAKDMLRNTTQSIGEIAFLTGFSEQSAFNRAFKKWTDLTPSEFRKPN